MIKMRQSDTRRFLLPLAISPLPFILMIGLAVLVLLSSCSPVRSGSAKGQFPQEEKQPMMADTLDESDPWADEEAMLGSGTNSLTNKPKDTLIVFLDPLIYRYDNTNNTKAIDQQITDISELLDNGMADKACTLAEGLWSSLEQGEQKWHARFFMGECLISKNELEEAKSIFKEILDSDARKDGREKSLIRMGQISCLDGDAATANGYFIELRTNYPKSIYLPLAACP